jgi:hypothetical protein
VTHVPSTRAERKAAVKAWRRVPTDSRAETVRLARKGRSHPDPGIAGIAETWAHSVVSGPWYGQVGGWPVIGIGLVIVTIGAMLSAFFIWLMGFVVIVAGFLGLNQRFVARRILAAAEDHAT